MNGPRLEAPGVTLRPIEPEDNPRLVAWRNSAEVAQGLFSEGRLTLPEQEAWYRRYLDDPSQARFVIESPQLGPVGCCGLTDRDAAGASAGLSIFLGEPLARRQGLAREALGALLDFAFGAWKLKRVVAELYADNLPARHLYASAGFREVGPGRPRRGRPVMVMERAAP